MDITRHIYALHEERINFAEFYKLTLPFYRAMAYSLHRKYRVSPSKLDPEDTIQNMMLYFQKVFKKWSPAKGMTLPAYVTWAVGRYAERQIHKARGVLKVSNGAKHQTCGERPNSEFMTTDCEEGPIDRASVRPGQESAEDILDALARTRDERDERIIADLISTYYNEQPTAADFVPMGKARGAKQSDAGIKYDEQMAAIRKVVGRMKEPEHAMAI